MFLENSKTIRVDFENRREEIKNVNDTLLIFNNEKQDNKLKNTLLDKSTVFKIHSFFTKQGEKEIIFQISFFVGDKEFFVFGVCPGINLENMQKNNLKITVDIDDIVLNFKYSILEKPTEKQDDYFVLKLIDSKVSEVVKKEESKIIIPRQA